MTWMQLADLRQSVSMSQKTLGRNRLLLACAIAALAAGSALAQQPLQPLPKVGGCQLGYYRALAATASPAPRTTPTSKP